MGVHTGPIVRGHIRLGRDNHLVTLGHAVDVAARLQNATKELNNSFIVSEAVIRLLSTPPARYRQMSLALRGVSRPLQVYLLGEPYVQPVPQAAP